MALRNRLAARERKGTLSQDNFNPLDVKWVEGGPANQYAAKDANGEPLRDKKNHLIFPNKEAGWAGGRADVKAKISGRNRHGLTADSTLASFGQVYAEDPEWANKVAQMLGVDTSIKVGELPVDDFIEKIAHQEGWYKGREDQAGKFAERPEGAEGGMLDDYESPGVELPGSEIDLVEHQTKGARDIAWLYDPKKKASGGVELPGSELEEEVEEEEVDRTPAFSKAIASASPADRQIANLYIAEIKKDPTARSPKVNGLTIQQQDNAEAVQALVSEYTNSLEYDRAVTAFQQQQVEQPEEERLLERQLLQRGKTTPSLDALAEQARVANLPQATIAESTDYRPSGARDTGYLYDQGERISREEAEEILGPEEIARVREEDELGLTSTATGPSGVQQRRGRFESRKRSERDFPFRQIEQPVAAPDDEGGLLQSLAGLGGGIGGWAKENPELLMAGLQTIGELGGQYKRGRREQEASDAEAQERRMSGAISALTRGRVTPEVGRRVPRTTAGEGMFDVLAGIGRGGQEFLGQKRGLEEQERLRGIQEDAIAAEKAEADRRYELDKYGRETERLAVTGKNGTDAGTEAQKVDDAQMIMAHVSGLLETFEEGGPLTTGALAGAVAGERNYDPFGDAPRIQQEYESQKIVLFEFVKELGKLGRLSDKDVELIERTLPDKFTGKQRLQGAYNGIAKVLNRNTRGAFEAGPSPFEEGYDPERNMRLLRRGGGSAPPFGQYSDENLTGMTGEELDDLSVEELDDLQAELEERGLHL